MPVDYVVVAVAAIGAAMTASPAVFGRWRRPKLRRWAFAASALTLLIGIVAVFASLGSGFTTPEAYALLVTCVALSAVGMFLIARDERSPDTAVLVPEPPSAVEGVEPTPEDAGLPTEAEPDADLAEDVDDETSATAEDLREEALLFSTTTRHGWGAELAELLAADDTDDTPPPPPRRGA